METIDSKTVDVLWIRPTIAVGCEAKLPFLC